MLTPDFAVLLLVLLGLVFSLVVHECAHAIVAWWCGDDTARLLGRITLNPVPHIDPFMSILLPAAMLLMSNGQMAFGGAKPVPVNPYNLRRPRRDMMLVALAGPASNVALAFAFATLANAILLLRADREFTVALLKVLFGIVNLNVVLAFFNLIPVPPLDGSRVLSYFLPSDLAHSMARLERYGMLIVGVLVLSGATSQLLWPVTGVTEWIWKTMIFLR